MWKKIFLNHENEKEGKYKKRKGKMKKVLERKRNKKEFKKKWKTE